MSSASLRRARAFVENTRELSLQYADGVLAASGRPSPFVSVTFNAETLDHLLIDIEAGIQESQVYLRQVEIEVSRRRQAEALLRFERRAFTVSLVAIATVLFMAFGGWL